MMLASRLSCALVAASVFPELEYPLDCPLRSNAASDPGCTLLEPRVGLVMALACVMGVGGVRGGRRASEGFDESR